MKFTLLLLPLIALVIVGMLVAVASSKKKGGLERWPFERRMVLTAAEQPMYFRLVEALPDCVVLAQVQLSQVVQAKGSDWRTWRNKVVQKSLDFVVCSKSFNVIAAVELDDRTHDRDDRKKADADKEKALSDAGIPLIRWKAKTIPDVAAVQQAIAAITTPKTST